MDRQPGRESTITVAAIQTRAITGDKRGNNERALEAIHRACDEGARLLVLPELGNSGYVFNTRDEVAELAEPVFGWLCGSLAEADGGRYYNAAALVGPTGGPTCSTRCSATGRRRARPAALRAGLGHRGADRGVRARVSLGPIILVKSVDVAPVPRRPSTTGTGSSTARGHGLPRLRSAVRYECALGEPRYLAVYQLESEDALTTRRCSASAASARCSPRPQLPRAHLPPHPRVSVRVADVEE